jgi:hypothetical protein
MESLSFLPVLLLPQKIDVMKFIGVDINLLKNPCSFSGFI